MLIDLGPLKRNRDFRFLYLGQFVSAVGSMLTYVALPYQLYHLTGSSLAVGMVGVAQLVPLLLTAFIGGAYADAMDRRKLLLGSEALLALLSLSLALNSRLAHPKIWLIYLVAGLMSGVTGFHRPALDAMTPRLVSREEIPSTSALTSLRGNIAAIGGPALGGILIAAWGIPATFSVDVATFIFSLGALAMIHAVPPSSHAEKPSFRSVLDGLRYARSRQELVGTYVIDFMAMVFGMPTALFPAIADQLGGPLNGAHVLGWLTSAPSAGALVATLFSGWTRKARRHGALVAVAALVWGIAITAFGFAPSVVWAVIFLAAAGAADMVSAIFRSTIWNQTIPDHLRGRLAGIEMVSYMSGPLLGNAESGLVAGMAGTQFSVVSGGVLCILGVGVCTWMLPRFWSYDSEEFHQRSLAEKAAAELAP